MGRAKVYFAPVSNGEDIASLAEKAYRLSEVAGFRELVAKGRPCAIKQHFGEDENRGYVKPAVTARIAELVKRAGGDPFVTDTNTLYRGRRSQAVQHILMAQEHGFALEAVGAPVIIADGLHGADQVVVQIDKGRHFKEVRIATVLHQVPSCIVLTHVKGHCQMGLGGSIKNVGMGCSARAGKLAQHQGGQPQFKEIKCLGCGICADWCPTDAIDLEGGKARLDPERCIGCGECLALCPEDAIGFTWLTEGPELTEKVCEHALGFLANKGGRVGYINFVTDVTKNCDCVGQAQEAEYPDVGIFASTDLVAVDKAVADVTRRVYGKDIWLEWWPESKYPVQFEYGSEIGLGSPDYELIELK